MQLPYADILYFHTGFVANPSILVHIGRTLYRQLLVYIDIDWSMDHTFHHTNQAGGKKKGIFKGRYPTKYDFV